MFGRRALAYAAILPSVREALHDEYDRVAESERAMMKMHTDRAVSASRADAVRESLSIITREIKHIERHAPGRRALKALTVVRARIQRKFESSAEID